MASNTIILTQPESENVINHEIPNDSSARLNYDVQDIEGLAIGPNGELVITFEDGGQVNITNFESFTEGGNLLYLSDGTLVDATILTSAPLNPMALNNIETAVGDSQTQTIAKPAAGETQEISVEEGMNYVCDFDPENAALVEVKDGQMILTFADGSQVVINNYNDVVAGQLPEELTVSDAVVVEEEILTEVTEVTDVEDIVEGESEGTETVAVQQQTEPEPQAEQVANIEPAAGEDLDAIAQQLQDIEPAAGEGAGSAGRGYGFNSAPVDVTFAAPDAVGPLGPTALQYNAPQFQDELLLEENAPFDPRPGMNPDALTLDETDLSGGPLVGTGNVNVDFGGDGNGGIAPNGNVDVTCDFAGVELTSGGVAVDIVTTVDGYTGTAGGNPVFTFVIDPETGDYTYTQVAPFDHGITTDDNEEICLNFGITATDGDGDQTSTNVQINVADDAPEILSQQATTVDETAADADANGKTSVNGQFFADAGQDVGATYGGTGIVTPSVVLTSNGEAVNVTYDAGTATYTGATASETIFTVEMDTATDEYVFTLCGPLDHPDSTNPDDNISIEFGAFITDFDGDTKEGSFVVNILDDGPVIEGNSSEIDETDGTGTVSGSVFTDFGYDGGTVEGNDNFSSSVANLTSGGEDITVTYDETTDTYTGSTVSGDVFTLVIDANGDYTFELLAPIDHPDSTDPDDSVVLTFGVEATDNDGDSASGNISITVKDDGPSVGSAQSVVDETDGNVVVNGNLTIDGGFDGVQDFGPTGDFAASGSKAPGPLTSGGEEVVVTFDAGTGTYTGATATDTIFTMTINDDGSYEFELLGTLDHADPNNPNDIINLDFTVQVTDNDGDTAENIIRILVQDDVPTIGDSSGDVDETNLDQGPLVHQDILNTSFGADVATISADGTTGSSVPLTSGGDAVTIGLVDNTYTGTTTGGDVVFTLEVNPTTGEYIYTQTLPLDHPDSNNPDDTLSIDFGVQITSVDGDNDTGTITITVADDGPVANDDINGAEEGQTITGNLLVNDELSEDGNNTVTNVNFEGTDYTVPAGGSQTINGDYGTLTVNSDGTYEYVTNNNDPDGTDTFVYTLTDRDGDSDTAQLAIRVTPDGQPVAVSEELAVDETNLTPGPMIFNGDLDVDFGLDGAGQVLPQDTVVAGGSLKDGTLTSNDVPVDINLVGDTYTGTAGNEVIFTLEVREDGTYTFQLFSHLDHADATDPNDAITLDFDVLAVDADGDGTMGKINILIYDDAPVAYDDGTTTLDESQTVNGNVTNNDELSEDKPNHVVEVTFNGTTTTVPVGGAPVQINGNYGVLTISSDGTYSYTANDDNPEGTDTYTYVLEDFDGDQDTAEISFRVNPLNDNPIIVKPDTEVVDETNLDSGDLVATGQVEANFFGDGPGTIDPNGNFSSSVPLTSGGVAVNVTSEGNVYTGTAGTEVIFTLEVNDDGSFTYTQVGVLDHPDTTDHNDDITLNFGVTATDKDGDQASTSVMVQVLDDGPVIHSKARPIDESDADANGELSYTHTLNFDFGEDGAGEIGTNGTFQAKYQVGGQNQQLKSGGENVIVTNDANSYTGTTAGGAVVFTLVIDPLTGEYTYTQFQAIDHPDETNPDDVIWLKFGVDITDNDGDTDDAFIIVDLHDDGPIARDDTNTSDDSNSVSGNVTDNDDFGYDGEGSVQSVTFEGTTYDVAETGNTTIEGNYGTLVINADGDYTYTANGNAGETIYSYNIDNPNGGTGAGDIKNVNTQYNEGTEEFTFSVTVEPSAEGFTLAINNGPNPKGHAGEMALFYFDASNPGTPVVTAYNYNGQNTQTSWMDGSPAGGTQAPDQILSSLLNAGAFGSITSTTDGNGNVVYSFSVDASVLQNHVPTYGNAADWTGVEFGEEVGIWLHPVSGLETEYTDGFLSQWDISSQSWYDTSHRDTTTTSGGGKDTFTYTIEDADGDTSSAELCVKAQGVDGKPTIEKKTQAVNEEDLGDGTITKTGQFTFDFGEDGPGSITTNGEVITRDTPSGENLDLYSCDMLVTITSTGNGYVGIREDGTTVFDMTIDNDGNYVYNQYEPVDHPKEDLVGTDDVLWVKLGVTITDEDGDTATSFLQIDIRDDGPEIHNKARRLDESDSDGNGEVSYTHTLNFDFGEDGAGAITTTDTFEAKYQVGGQDQQLTSGGENVNVTSTANSYTGTTTSGAVVFTLVVDPTSGQYTYTQFQGIDHPDTDNANDVIWLKFGVEITDKDGDTDDAYIIVDLEDDGPCAHDDSKSGEAGDVITGNVTDNDNFGYDGEGCVLKVSFDGQSVDVPETGVATIAGDYGTLEISADGSYTYTANDAYGDGIVRDTFVYTLKDADGDTDTANLNIDIELSPEPNDVPHITHPGLETVDETDLEGGNLVETGKIVVDFKNDGPGTIDPNGTFTSSVNNLKSCDMDVTVTNDGNGYTGTRSDGTVVFTLAIQNNGDYTFTQFEAIDHPNSNNPNDAITLNFGVVATDEDGDSVSTTVSVRVLDDGPDANNDSASGDTDGNITGNVTNNDDYGQDGAGAVTQVQFGGNTVDVPTTGQATVTGNHGTLRIAADGSYTYIPNDVYGDGTVRDTFTYTIADKDGDTDHANLNVDVTLTPEPLEGPNGKDDFCTLILPYQPTFSANLISNDTFANAGGRVQAIVVNGTTHNVTAQGVTVAVAYGEIFIKSNGDYTFSVTNPDDTPTTSQNFDVVITDSSGLTDTTTFQFNIVGSDLEGTDGNDTINGSSANDIINGNAGQDVLNGRGGDDTISGGEDWDTLDGGEGNDTLRGDEGNDLLIGREGNDIIYGGTDNDDIYGDGGVDDTYVGNDNLYGGAGDDYIYGGRGTDYIEGNGNNDILYGGDGNDTILGGSGNDDIIGQEGNDTLTGGSGADTFWFLAINEGQDTIKDFNTAEDALELSNVLTGFDAGEDINDFLFAVRENGDTTILADNSGSGNINNATQIVTLENDDVTINQLMSNGNIIV